MSDLLQAADLWGPEKVVCVADARTGMRGVLVVDNTARGIGKGGTRMQPDVIVAEVARLARVMTWKWAAVDLFFGGAKAGIRFDPHHADKERVLRAFVRALANEVPTEYVLGLDMGLTEADAAVVQDELGDRGAAVGTPRELGGVPYDQWGVTGFGVAEAADAARQAGGETLAGASVVVQGFGAVGVAAARRAVELGAYVTGVASAKGTVHAPDGLDLPRLEALRAELGDGCVAAYDGPGVYHASADAVLDLRADVLIPAATQDVVDAARAHELRFGLVVEGANLPIRPDALAVLAARGVPVVPDFIANAGGVVAAAYAMDRRHSPFPVEPDAIFAAVAQKTRENTATVLAAAASDGTTPHEAARALAQARVRRAMELKGRLPAALAAA